MGIRLEDIRALLTIIIVLLAAYLQFYASIIKYYMPEYTVGYQIFKEGLQAAAGISISIYFEARRIERKHAREPLKLPRNVIRVFLLFNALFSLINGLFYFSETQNPEFLNIAFMISIFVGIMIWLWPKQEELTTDQTMQKKVIPNNGRTKLKPWELEHRHDF